MLIAGIIEIIIEIVVGVIIEGMAVNGIFISVGSREYRGVLFVKRRIVG